MHDVKAFALSGRNAHGYSIAACESAPVVVIIEDNSFLALLFSGWLLTGYYSLSQPQQAFFDYVKRRSHRCGYGGQRRQTFTPLLDNELALGSVLRVLISDGSREDY